MTKDLITGDPIDQALRDDRNQLLEIEAKQLLSDAGITVPDSKLASSPSVAVETAEAIGYPVVLKVSADAVQHKSEWADGGGVEVGLRDGEEVQSAAERIFRAADREDIGADVLVETAADTGSGTETIVGGVRDDTFGPTVLFGLGGVFTEVLQDTSHRLAPVSIEETLEMVGEIDGAKLLDGYRGHNAVDQQVLAETITTLGDLLVNRDEIGEIEINPLLAGPDDEVIALDALVTLR